jgi:ABC-2 type transport system ATP-binding protein
LLGLASATSGRASIFGRSPADAAARVQTGALLQVSKVPETLRVGEHIELFSSYYPRPLPFAETIAAAGLEGLEKRLFGDLSGGQKQRVLFALALCGNPRLLFLDEPTVGLDVETRRMLWSRIRAFVDGGGSVLLTTHYLDEADQLADRIAVLSAGRIVAQGTPSQIKSRTAAKTIRCTTCLDEPLLRAIPGIAEVRRNHRGFEILTGEAERVTRELLARDPSLSQLEIVSAGLEEAFLRLTEQEVAQ